MNGGVGNLPWYESFYVLSRMSVLRLTCELQIYIVASFFLYTLFLISIIDTKPSPTAAHCSTWIVGLIMEWILLGASLATYSSEHREPTAGHGKGEARHGVTTWEAIEIFVDLVRIILICALIAFYALFVLLRWSKARSAYRGENGTTEETLGLLNGNANENGNANGNDYGSTNPDKAEEEVPGWVRPDKVKSKSWWEYIRGYSLFFPYLWPAKSVRLQLVVLICFAIVVVQRAINVLVPMQAGAITNTLSGEGGTRKSAVWGQICLFILYRLMQGGNGLLGAVRSTLWLPIGQYSYKELSTAAFEHVHGLSLDFHLGKKTGEVLSAMSKGSSINTFLEQVTFQVVPMLIDLVVAMGYFLVFFDAYYALVVAVVTCAYLYLTIRLAQWRANQRRHMTNLDRQSDAVK